MLVECPKCKEEMPETDLISVEIYPETILDPAEFESKCPHCGFQGEIPTVEVTLCISCNDVRVKDEGDQCGECHTCQQEELADAAKYP